MSTTLKAMDKAILDELRRERESDSQDIRTRLNGSQQQQEFYRLNKEYFGKYDAWLDQCLFESPIWLAQEPVARFVMDELHSQNGDRYTLIAFCIMPNHVHLLIDTTNGKIARQPLGSTRNYPFTVLRLSKDAPPAIAISVRSGAFWHNESYDHVVRMNVMRSFQGAHHRYIWRCMVRRRDCRPRSSPKVEMAWLVSRTSWLDQLPACRMAAQILPVQ
jgi:hypothetical protein